MDLSPAMRTALFHKPHDRQFIVDLENSILSFIESNAESYQLRPMNSYYRLLSHQIAEFHGLKHALARAHDNCVIIFKGDQFRATKGGRLLQHLGPASPKSDESSKSSSPVGGSQNPDAKSGRRYRILKRQGDLQDCVTPPSEEDCELDTNAQNDANDSVANLENQKIERERRYEQRKQEIFDTPKKDQATSEKDKDGTSPQPSEFETSRYQFHQIDSSPPPQQRNNNRRRRINNSGATKDRAASYYNENRFGYNDFSSNLPVSYNAGYMIYPTPPMGPGGLSSTQFPMMYPTPFPMDSGNGYIPQYMYQPMGESGDPKGAGAGGFMPYPFPYPYGQLPPSYQHRGQNMQHPYGHYASTSRSSSRGGETQHISYVQSKHQKERAEKSSSQSAEEHEEGANSDTDEAAKGIENLSV